VHSLPIFVRLDGRPVILIGTGDTADAKRRLLERAGARLVGEDAQAQLAIVVDDDAAVARLKARGVLVNAVDRPDLCDFTLPAIVDRSPVMIAIGTGGASAGLAKALRQRLEILLPRRLGNLATALHAARDRIRARWPDAAPRRVAIDEAMLGPLDPMRDHEDGAVGAWLDGFTRDRSIEHCVMRVGDGFPEDLPLSALRLLGQANAVVAPDDMLAVLTPFIRADAARFTARPDHAIAGLTVELVRDDG
jgi:uroporphyrin-III C-methyltransferase/precorrin-2 dehydrogenase/sirohydrochlorin ferrochelatase